ncbi:MAG: PIG-L family deacetylase, partial [Paraburkholderia sp.]
MSETSPRLFIVSPHFDDAVFSCGALLATHPDAVVCTVFAAAPEQNIQTEWDNKAGFTGAHESVNARTLEDNRALELFDAVPVRMPFRDGQYLDSPSISRLAGALE